MQGQRPGPWATNVYSVTIMQGSPWGPLAVRRLDAWGLDSAPPLTGPATAAATCRSGSEAKVSLALKEHMSHIMQGLALGT